jgi:glycosyltransferase involved in cell wall biosynthesis
VARLPPPIRVVRVITRLNIGGPSIQAIELSSRMTMHGFETVLVHGRLGESEGDMVYLLDQAAVRPRTVHLQTLQRPIAPAADAAALWKLYRLICDVKPAIVHTHMAKAGTLGRLAALAYNRTTGRRAPAKLVHTYHGHVLEGYFGAAKTRLFVDVERTLAAATDRIVAISPRIRDELIDEYRIGHSAQYRIVPLGFDLERLAAIDASARRMARMQLQIPEGTQVVTTVGRLTAIKDHRLFLEVARRVSGLWPSTIFLIVGDGELRGELEASAAALGIGERVQFLGWRRDLETVYGATDIFLLTSRNEGTPVALIESLAAGCAGVSTDVGGVGDVVDSDAVGLLAPDGDAEALAARVASLLADAPRRQVMREAGRRVVLGRYELTRLVSDVASLYRDLLT